jgi:hypothetical protein
MVRIMGVFSGPLNKELGSLTDIFWWYKPNIYGGLCPICFSKELSFSGFIFLINLFWSMFLKLKRVHTHFNHVYVQHWMTFFLQQKRHTFPLKIWQLLTP